MDPDLATPMIRHEGQDFYTLEPTLLQDGRICMPFRWFIRNGKTLARAWAMSQDTDAQGWIVLKHTEFDVAETELVTVFPSLKETFRSYRVLDPRRIIGVYSPCLVYSLYLLTLNTTGYQDSVHGEILPWMLTDPQAGNRWRTLACGRRVVAFPIWLYCDDTSGNLSKKWNKHNSFLFTPAGLPRRLVHQEYNVHFLATSNLAPPLEMLDGVVDQLE